MILKEFKEHIESFDDGKIFNYGISEPFSWRGSYDEVCFTIIDKETNKIEILKNINKAYNDLFYGYKGGEYKFKDYTQIHFESSRSSYSDGEYVLEYLAKLGDAYNDNEEAFIKKGFV